MDLSSRCHPTFLQFQSQARGPETVLLRDLQEAVCGQVQPGEPSVAAQKPKSPSLQVSAVQEGRLT